MKKIILGITLACAALAAQSQSKPAFENYLNLVGGVGFTYGGDKLATGTMDKNKLMAGKGLLFAAGLDFRLTETFSLQSTIGANEPRHTRGPACVRIDGCSPPPQCHFS
jgi:hypothetical protein